MEFSNETAREEPSTPTTNAASRVFNVISPNQNVSLLQRRYVAVIPKDTDACFKSSKQPGNIKWRMVVKMVSDNREDFPVWNDDIVVVVKETLRWEHEITRFLISLDANGYPSRKIEDGQWYQATEQEIIQKTRERFVEYRKTRYQARLQGTRRPSGRPRNNNTVGVSIPVVPFAASAHQQQQELPTTTTHQTSYATHGPSYAGLIALLTHMENLLTNLCDDLCPRLATALQAYPAVVAYYSRLCHLQLKAEMINDFLRERIGQDRKPPATIGDLTGLTRTTTDDPESLLHSDDELVQSSLSSFSLEALDQIMMEDESLMHTQQLFDDPPFRRITAVNPSNTNPFRDVYRTAASLIPAAASSTTSPARAPPQSSEIPSFRQQPHAAVSSLTNVSYPKKDVYRQRRDFATGDSVVLADVSSNSDKDTTIATEVHPILLKANVHTKPETRLSASPQGKGIPILPNKPCSSSHNNADEQENDTPLHNRSKNRVGGALNTTNAEQQKSAHISATNELHHESLIDIATAKRWRKYHLCDKHRLDIPEREVNSTLRRRRAEQFRELLAEMDASQDNNNSYECISQIVNREDWKELLASLNADEFGCIIAHVAADLDRPSIAELVASHINAFTTEHVSQAIQKTTTFRVSIAGRLCKFCPDPIKTRASIDKELNDDQDVNLLTDFLASALKV